MKGLPERFASLQQEKGYSNTLRLLKDVFFFQATRPLEQPQANAAVKLKEFIAGLSRSGTGSLAVALAELGYTPLHGLGIMQLEYILEEHYADCVTNLDILKWQEEHGYDANGFSFCLRIDA